MKKLTIKERAELIVIRLSLVCPTGLLLYWLSVQAGLAFSLMQVLCGTWFIEIIVFSYIEMLKSYEVI